MYEKTAVQQLIEKQLEMQELLYPNRDLLKSFGINNWSTNLASSLLTDSAAQKTLNRIVNNFDLIKDLYQNLDSMDVPSPRVPYRPSQEKLSAEAYDLANDAIIHCESHEVLADNRCLVSAKEDLKREKEDNTLSPLQKFMTFINIATFVIFCGTSTSGQIDSIKIQNSLDTIIQIEQSENEQNNRQQVSLDRIADLLERQTKILEENKEPQNNE